MRKDGYMTAPMLAEYRGESLRSARRFLACGKVPVYRDGGRPRVLKSEIDAFMATRRIEPRKQPTTLKAMLDEISNRVLGKGKLCE